MALRDEHPDDDQLADLAADVLPLAQARAVEAHVLACDRCSELLADAERIRGLLVAGDPGPMPADVWARIEAALAGAGAPTQPATPIRPAAPVPPPAPAAHRSPGGWTDEDADPLDRPDRWAAAAQVPATATSSLRRISVSRRDSRADARRPGRFLAAAGLAAAAVVGAVAVGVGVLHLGAGGASGGSAGTAALGDAGSPSPAAAAEGAVGGASAAAGGAAAPRYERTGTDYTSAGLDRQVRALVGPPGSPAAPPQSAAPRTAGAAPAPAATGVPGNATTRSSNLVGPDPTATDISNPAALAGCLTALKTSMDRLVAVDLATYEDREAAVLVLRATGGGYEVFVVERTCSASDDHSLAYRALKG